MSNKPTLWEEPDGPFKDYKLARIWRSGYRACLNSPELERLVRERDDRERFIARFLNRWKFTVLADDTSELAGHALVRDGYRLIKDRFTVDEKGDMQENSAIHPTQAKDE